MTTLSFPAQPVRGFTRSHLLHESSSQLSSLLPPRCMPSFCTARATLFPKNNWGRAATAAVATTQPRFVSKAGACQQKNNRTIAATSTTPTPATAGDSHKYHAIFTGTSVANGTIQPAPLANLHRSFINSAPGAQERIVPPYALHVLAQASLNSGARQMTRPRATL